MNPVLVTLALLLGITRSTVLIPQLQVRLEIRKVCCGCEWGGGKGGAGGLRMRKLKEGPSINKAHSSTCRAGDGRGGVGALALPHHVHTRNTPTNAH